MAARGSWLATAALLAALATALAGGAAAAATRSERDPGQQFLRPGETAMNDAASDPDLYPQLSNAAMGRAPGMPLSPELPSNYQFDATPSPRTVQTAEGAATRGRVEAAVFEAQLRESAAMRNLEEAAIQLKQNIDMALWFEGQYSTDPDKMPFQPGYKDKIIAAVRNIPNSYKVVEEMIQRVLPLIENTKKELAAVSGTVSATLP